MNVLHVSPSFYPANVYGGTITSGRGLCRSLVSLGCDLRVLTTDTNGINRSLEVDVHHESTVDGVRVRYCKKRFGHSVSAALVRQLPAYVSWADVVHLTAVYSFPTFPTLLTARLLKKPVVWSPRGALQRWEGSSRTSLKKRWDSICSRLARPENVVLHVTSTEEALQSARIFSDLPIRVIPNGVDVPLAVLREPGFQTLRLLYLGRLHPIKGIEALLDACSRLRRRLGDFRLRIAGSGAPSYVAYLKAMVEHCGFRERVEFIGYTSGADKETLFATSDVVVVPSHTENFAMVVAESLAHGIPVIASKGTPWQGLEAQGCGLWVENDAESLCQAMCRIREMPLQEMGDRGRRWMQEQYSWDSVGAKMLELYQEMSHVSANYQLAGARQEA
jgi:glycosyltransferase involved in cell wall biosynthesis